MALLREAGDPLRAAAFGSITDANEASWAHAQAAGFDVQVVERGADGAMTGYAFPDMLVDIVKLTQAGERDKAHDLFDAHLPLLRYEQQQGTTGLAVRKYVMARRGIIASDAQRKPAGSISATAKAEVEYLLSRVARVDPRAKLAAA